VDLNGTLTMMAGTFRGILGAQRPLTLNLQADSAPIRVDPTDLRENLLRLVVEARHAMPEGGTAEIRTAVAADADGGRSVELAIRDTGKGIRPSAKERVFDPYYQARPGNRNPALSLALVYQFVALNGGSIEVRNEPGEGVTYLLRFTWVDSGCANAGV
jgi:signal transduction histidine kinase